MKVFLSWSGSRSKTIAEVLNKWLRQVIQVVEPWISTDTQKGARWSPEISKRLEETKVGIICLTKDNLDENWILFEAGALSKTKDARVCTFLLDLKPSDIKNPLAQFQATQFDKEDVRKLLHTINHAVKEAGEHSLADKDLDEMFDSIHWSRLEKELKGIQVQKSEVDVPIRKDRDLLEEILTHVRSLGRGLPSEWIRGPYARALASYPSHGYQQASLETLLTSLGNMPSEQREEIFKAINEKSKTQGLIQTLTSSSPDEHKEGQKQV